jgi:hypothetical protein
VWRLTTSLHGARAAKLEVLLEVVELRSALANNSSLFSRLLWLRTTKRIQGRTTYIFRKFTGIKPMAVVNRLFIKWPARLYVEAFLFADAAAMVPRVFAGMDVACGASSVAGPRLW